jgi:hypothetical protein
MSGSSPSIARYPGQPKYSLTHSPTNPQHSNGNFSQANRIRSPSLTELNQARLAALSSLPKTTTPAGNFQPQFVNKAGNRSSLPPGFGTSNYRTVPVLTISIDAALEEPENSELFQVDVNDHRYHVAQDSVPGALDTTLHQLRHRQSLPAGFNVNSHQTTQCPRRSALAVPVNGSHASNPGTGYHVIRRMPTIRSRLNAVGNRTCLPPVPETGGYVDVPGNRYSLPPTASSSGYVNAPGNRISLPPARISNNHRAGQTPAMSSLGAALNGTDDRLSLPSFRASALDTPANRDPFPVPLRPGRKPSIAGLNEKHLNAVSALDQNQHGKRPIPTKGDMRAAGPEAYGAATKLSNPTQTSTLPHPLRISQPSEKNQSSLKRELSKPAKPLRKYRLPQRPPIPPNSEKIRKLLTEDPAGHLACTALINGLELREPIENGGVELDTAVDGLVEILQRVVGVESAGRIVDRHMLYLVSEMEGKAGKGASSSLSPPGAEAWNKHSADVPDVSSPVQSQVDDVFAGWI